MKVLSHLVRRINYSNIHQLHYKYSLSFVFNRSKVLRYSTFTHLRQQQHQYKKDDPHAIKPSSITKTSSASSSTRTTLDAASSSIIPLENESFHFYKSLVLSLILRGIAMLGIMHVIHNYIFTINACEGPSMEPTMKSSGEIILVERISHRLYGITDGTTGKEREKNARSRQQQFEMETQNQKYSKQQQLTTTNNEKENNTTSDLNFPIWYQSSHEEKRKKRVLWNKLTTGITNGDLIVMQHKQKNITICKRVIGLPGDMIIPQSPSSNNPNQHLIQVPDGHVWIEGDNTVASYDSRMYGCVPANLIIGKVFLKIWPLGDTHMFMESGDRPIPKDENEVFLGSLVLPAGYEGEEIVK